MKAAIIVFSPSGNTSRVAVLLKNALEQRDISTQFVDITGNPEYFSTPDKRGFLLRAVMSHDILFIGSPVYAHHLQYHMRDVITNLPEPGHGWGKAAIPFITYGGIDSGIALEEAGKLLKRSGRSVPAGLKVSGPHHMTKIFMKEAYNSNRTKEELSLSIQSLIDRIQLLDPNALKDQSQHLKYQSRKEFFKANILFREKFWHAKMYPKIVIDKSKCTNCGKCTSVCPVNHSSCIHCFNCVFQCPVRAVSPQGNIEKAQSFMQKMMKGVTEDQSPRLYPGL